jgi:hypothetical protein
MSQADGDENIKELAFIKEIGHRLGLNDENILEIKENKAFELNLPRNEQERLYMFFHALQLVEIDKKILSEEIDLLKKIGFKLSLNPLLVSDLVNLYINHLGKEIDANSLSAIITKYLN